MGRKLLRGCGVRGDCRPPGFPVSAVAWPSGKKALHQPQTWSPAAPFPPFPGWLLEEVRNHPTEMLIQTSHPPWPTTENVFLMLSPRFSVDGRNHSRNAGKIPSPALGLGGPNHSHLAITWDMKRPSCPEKECHPFGFGKVLCVGCRVSPSVHF